MFRFKAGLRSGYGDQVFLQQLQNICLLQFASKLNYRVVDGIQDANLPKVRKAHQPKEIHAAQGKMWNLPQKGAEALQADYDVVTIVVSPRIAIS